MNPHEPTSPIGEGRAHSPSPHESADIRRVLMVLWARKWSIVSVLVIVVGAALGYSFSQSKVYVSEARVLVHPVEVAANAGGQALNLETERGLASSQQVAEMAAERIEANDLEALVEQLEVSVVTNTEFLRFDFSASSPKAAQDGAQAFAVSYLKVRREQALNDLLASSTSLRDRVQVLNESLNAVNVELARTNDEAKQATLQAEANSLVGQIALLEQQIGNLTPPDNFRVGQVVQPADLPEGPASPNHLTTLILALFVGASLGVGVGFLRDRIDDRLRDISDLEAHTQAPVIGRIASYPAKRGAELSLTTVDDPEAAAAEAFRTLRTSLLFAAKQRNYKTFLVTSALPSEGKSSTTANLAAALASAGKRVVIVSADLRRPTLHRFFGSHNQIGLANVLAGEVSVSGALSWVGVDNLRLLPSGAVPGNPAELLGSDEMASVIATAEEGADIVLVDCAPVLGIADTTSLVPVADAVLLVVDASQARRGAIDHARKQLHQVEAKILGVVLNRFDASRSSGYGYAYSYPGAYKADDRPAPAEPQTQRSRT